MSLYATASKHKPSCFVETLGGPGGNAKSPTGRQFCEVTLWWNTQYFGNQVSPHFFWYPAELMLRKGNKVKVVTKLYPERNEREHEQDNGIEVSRFGRGLKEFCLESLRYMLRHRFCLIHHHTVGVIEDFVPWMVSRLKGTPIVFASHDPGLTNLFNRRDMWARFVRMTLKIREPREGVFIAFTEFQASLYRSIGIRKISVIPHGIDPSVFHVSKDRHISEKYGLEEQGNILCVGQIDPRKGQHILIESLPEILKTHPKTKLILVGRAFQEYQREYLNALKSEVGMRDLGKYVVFLNDVSNRELIQLYLFSNVFAFPTNAELFPLTLLEAMAAELPIVATDRPYIREILQGGEAGLLVQRSAREFARGILLLMNDESLRKSMVLKAKETVAEKYNLKRVIHMYDELYSSLLST